MDSLDYLVDRGLLTPKFGPIRIVGPIKVVGNGVIFQQQCHNGLPYDIAVSWLQKAIRRGLTDQALYCAYHIAHLGKIFRSHLLNRLVTILSEDIGPAEVGLATIIVSKYNKAKEYERDYAEVAAEAEAEAEAVLEMIHALITEMVTLLSSARKSRVADWAIHLAEANDEPPDDEYSDYQEMVCWATYHCRHRTRGEATVSYRDGRRAVKQLLVYQMWNRLLERAVDSTIYDDTVALLEMFQTRGPDYGLLNFAHAISLSFMGNKMKVADPRPATRPSWSEISQYDFPVLNASVDMHTRYGKLYLGRTMADFISHGSKLQPWTPMPGEQEMLERIRAGLVMPPVEDSKPRPYQEDLVDRAVEHFQTHSSGWLLMACGTGKTKTAYWIMRRFLDRGDALFVVVTPYLQILRQFHSCWASMNRMHKLNTITGIVASCTDDFGKDRYSNFEYLATSRDIRRFLGYSSPKIVFTTYASLSKLKHLSPGLVIYDEAHHVSAHHLFQGQGEGPGAGAGMTRSLYLTATPRGTGQVIGAYNLRNAIDDRFLTPYKVSIMQGMNVAECLSYIGQHNSKTIVYATNNAVSRQLWRLWCEQLGGEEGIYYLDCKTPRRTREETLDNFSSRDKAIIFNCSVLGEGVDLPSCDSILIYSGYSTEVRITQAMGRPLRLHRGKELANIYLIDDKKTDIRILGMSKYDPEVYNHVQCLGVYDD